MTVQQERQSEIDCVKPGHLRYLLMLPDMKNTLPLVLLTGFEVFGGDSLNPSWLAVQALNGQIIEGHRVLAGQLPVVFETSHKQLKVLLLQHRPALVLCLGLAGGREGLSLERVAINIQDSRIADNSGAQPIDVPITKSGPAAYLSTLPIKAMLRAITAVGLPGEVSQTAGTFVCNHVFYSLMRILKKHRHFLHARGGFMHVPYLPGQGDPNMPLVDIVRGLRAAVACALITQTDVLSGAGSLN